MAEPVFAVESAVYHYQTQVALNGLSMRIEPGERVALLGANGSGKSTLLRLLDALYFAERGSVRFRGTSLTEEQMEDDAFAFDFRRRVGLVFQNPDVQLFNPTVFDEIAFGPLQLRWPKQQIRDQVAEVLDRLEIAHLTDRPPHRLSGGEKKRVALASVLVLDPEVLLLDEPTASLDPKSQGQIIDFICGWGGGVKTVVTATHDLDSVEYIADRCYVLHDGLVAGAGKPAEVLADRALLQRTNLIHAHLHRHASGEIHSHPHRHPHE